MIDSEDEESCSSYSDEDEEDEVFPQLKPSRYSSYTGVRQQSTLAGADEDGGEEDDEEEEEEDQESAEDTLREEMIRKLTQVLVSRLPQEGIPHMQYADLLENALWARVEGSGVGNVLKVYHETAANILHRLGYDRSDKVPEILRKSWEKREWDTVLNHFGKKSKNRIRTEAAKGGGMKKSHGSNGSLDSLTPASAGGGGTQVKTTRGTHGGMAAAAAALTSKMKKANAKNNGSATTTTTTTRGGATPKRGKKRPLPKTEDDDGLALDEDMPLSAVKAKIGASGNGKKGGNSSSGSARKTRSKANPLTSSRANGRDKSIASSPMALGLDRSAASSPALSSSLGAASSRSAETGGGMVKGKRKIIQIDDTARLRSTSPAPGDHNNRKVTPAGLNERGRKKGGGAGEAEDKKPAGGGGGGGGGTSSQVAPGQALRDAAREKREAERLQAQQEKKRRIAAEAEEKRKRIAHRREADRKRHENLKRTVIFDDDRALIASFIASGVDVFGTFRSNATPIQGRGGGANKKTG